MIYEKLDFICEHIDEKGVCGGHLHLTRHTAKTLEFKCFKCGNYTCMSYEIANVINQSTGKPPKENK